MHNAAVDLDAVWPWLLRIAAVLLAGGSGWSFGRSVPSWQEDQRMDATDYTAHAYGYQGGHFSRDGMFGSGCGALGCTMLLQGLRGSLWGTLCTGGALVVTYFAWSWEFLDGQGVEDYGIAVAMLMHPAIWTLIGGTVAGYIASVATDKSAKSDPRDSWEP